MGNLINAISIEEDEIRPSKKSKTQLKRLDVVDLDSINLKICMPKDETTSLEKIITFNKHEKLDTEICKKVEKCDTLEKVKSMEKSYETFLKRMLTENCTPIFSDKLFYNEKRNVFVTNLYFDIQVKDLTVFSSDILLIFFKEYNYENYKELNDLFRSDKYKETDFITKIVITWKNDSSHIFLVKINADRKTMSIIDTHNYWKHIDDEREKIEKFLLYFSPHESIDISDISSNVNLQQYDKDFNTYGYCALWSLYFIWRYIKTSLTFIDIYKELESLDNTLYPHIYQHLILIFYNTVGHFTRSEGFFFKKSVQKIKQKKSTQKIKQKKSTQKIKQKKSLQNKDTQKKVLKEKR
jgi:hypothetical protein